MKKNENVLKEVLKKINPPENDLKYIKNQVNIFSQEIKKNIKKYKINAEIFVGGSFAKKTLIKKDKYDVDIFVRYDKKYTNEELFSLTKKLISTYKNVIIIHGSRDYFRINYENNFSIELIPVKKVSNSRDYENITDLSYLHVKYINKKIKSNKLLDEIKLAKAFCYANNCYGAESYISGFSGYSLELLVYYYKGFRNFVNAMTKIKKDKEIIDIEKQFRNKKNVLLDLNSSKLNSPIILIDPTYKQRNALAALSQETFEKFQKSCIEFVKNPSIKFFEIKKTDLDKIKSNALKAGKEFILVETKTDKSEGDIAGSKLLKFYNYLENQINRFFIIKNKGFNYNGKSSARYFFVTEKRKEVICSGPFNDDKENSSRFKREHKEVYEEKGRLYAKEKIDFTIKQFLENWKLRNPKVINEMYITNLTIN